jgi:acetyl-CoA synthetase
MEETVNGKFYYPSTLVVENANVREYDEMYRYSIANREEFWATQAESLHWFRK